MAQFIDFEKELTKRTKDKALDVLLTVQSVLTAPLTVPVRPARYSRISLGI